MRKRSIRRRAVVTLWALVLGFWASTATGVSWALPLPSWSSVRAALGAGPGQGYGSSDGRSHLVSAASTRARAGAAGKAAGTAPGQLPAYQAKAPVHTAVKTGASPVGSHRGFDAKTSVFDAHASTAQQDVFQNADGTVSVKDYQRPVNFRRPDGTWAKIDTTLARGSAGRLAESASGDAGVSFASSAADPSLLSYSFGPGESVSFGLVGAADVAPTVSGSVASYVGVLPGVDLQLQALAQGSKESVVLASDRAQRTFTYTMRLTGLTARISADGSVEFLDAAGAVVGLVPHGVMTDSKVATASRQAPTSYGVSYALTTVNGSAALRMTLDGAWLDDPARVYPVTVDPTVYGSPNINTSADTYALNQGRNNNSTDSVLKVGTCNVSVTAGCGITVKSVSFLSFPNIGSTYQNDVIDSASLNLLDVWAETCMAQTFSVAPVTQSWSASALVQYPGYSLGGAIGSATLNPGTACQTSTGAGTWMSVGLSTGLFNSWTAGTGTNYGLGVYAADQDGTWKQFASLNSANVPYLLLTYQANTAPSVTGEDPPSGEALQSLTPQLTASGWDPDAFPGKPLQYEFQVLDDSSGTPTVVSDSGTLTAGSSTSPVAWSVPSGVLKWSGSFSWQVRVSDQIGWGSWSYPSYFNLAVAQPPITSHLGGTNGSRGYDALTGNYTSQATDADVSGVGAPLTVQRTYNSLDPRVGQAFGSGWSSVLDSRAQVDPDGSGNVVVGFANGQQVRFGRNADGSFSAPSGMFSTLSAAQSSEPAGSYCPSASSGYCLLDKSGTTYAFTVGGASGPWQLSQVADAQGRATLFGYNGSGQLASMTSCVSGCMGSSPVLSRSLSFTWGSAASLGSGAAFAHVTKVQSNPVSGTAPAGDLTWSYTYSGDRLAAVCDPVQQAGSCAQEASYSYAAGSQFSAAVLDAGPQGYWRLNDASGSSTARDQVLANEGTTSATAANVTFGTASGAAGPSAGSGAGPLNTGASVAAFDGSSSALTLPSNLVAGGTYLSVGLWFETSASSGPQILFSTGHSAVGTANPDGNAMPVLYVGSDGKLYGHYWNGSVTAMTSSGAVNDGKWHYVLLTAAGSTQWMYLDGVQVGSLPGSLDNSDPYDLVGTGVFNSFGWPAGGSGNTWSYFKGQISDVAFFPRTLGATTAGALYAAAAYPSALLTSVTKPSGAAQASVMYDVPNDRVTQVTDANGGVWQVAAPTVAGSSNVYAGAVLGSSPESYWRLSDGTPPLITVTSGVANNQVTHHTAVPASGCEPGVSRVCIQQLGTMTDPQGDGVYNHVTVGAAGTSPFGDVTGASFDGSSSFVQLPADLFPTGGPLAVELWFKTGSANGVLLGASSDPVTASSSATYDPVLYVGADGRLNAALWAPNNFATLTSPGAVTDGAWHHVVLTSDGASQTLYLDGVQVASKSGVVGMSGAPVVTVGAGWIGGVWPDEANYSTTNNAGGVLHFNGTITDVAEYWHGLSSGEVTAHYAALKSSVGMTPVVTAAVSDPLGLGEQTTYDPLNGGRMLSATDANGGITRYGYDTGGFLNTVTDPLGDVTTTGHDVRGNEVSKTTCQNQAANQCSTSYTTYWPDDASATLTPDPRDDLRLSTRDARSASASDPTFMTQYAYDPDGNLTSVTDPLGRTTASAYSTGAEKPLTVTLAANGAPTCTVAAASSGVIPAGLLLSKKSPGGGVTAYGYYPNGDLARVVNPLGGYTLYAYDGVGRVSFKTECSDTYPGGVVTGYAYDGDGRTLTETDPATTDAVTGVTHQKTTTTVYTPDGKVDHTTVSDTGGSSHPDAARTTSYTYYPTDLVKTVTDPVGAQSSYGYDAEGNKTSQTDPNGDSWQYRYNGTGQRVQTVLTNYNGTSAGPCQPTASQLVTDSRAFDLAGRLASVTDAMCRQTTYTYYDNGLTDTVTRLDPSKTDGSGVSETKAYDTVGNLVSDTAGNGLATTLTSYDAAGQSVLTQVQYGASLSGAPLYKNTQTSYNPDGHASSVVKWQDDGSGTIEQTDYAYDAAGDKLSQTVHDATPAQAQAASLAGAWPLSDGATTTARDGSGHGLSATLSGTTGWTGESPPAMPGSLWLDGATGQAATAASAVDTTASFAVSAWVKLTRTSGWSTAVSQDGSQDSGFYLEYDAADARWSFSRVTADTASPAPYRALSNAAPALNSWTHLVGVYTAGSGLMQLYVNGVLQSGTATDTTPFASPNGLVIGRSMFAGAQTSFFHGQISNVQVYNRVLTQADVNQLYANLSLGSRGLAGSWQLADGAALQAADSTGQNHPATPTGGVTWNAAHGGAAALDGSSGYLSTTGPVIDTSKSFTVTAWVNLASASGWDEIVSQDGSQDSGFFLENDASDGKWAFTRVGADSTSTTVTRALSTAAPSAGVWTHLAGVYDATAKTLALYVNGALNSTVSYTTGWSATGPLAIGRNEWNGAFGGFTGGQVSGVQLYSTALTGAQISTLNSGGSLLTPTTVLKTSWTYDQRGVQTSMTAPLGNVPGATAGSYTTTYTSDQAGRVVQSAQPPITTYTGGVASSSAVTPLTLTGYDTYGEKAETQDPDGNITAAAYDKDARPTDVTKPVYTQPVSGGATLQPTAHTDYNPDGTVKDTIDPAGHQTGYTYDQFGRVLTQTNPAISVNGTATQGTEQHQYDQDGEQTQLTDPTGAVTQATYNYLGQQITSTALITKPASATDTTQYFYDALGHQLAQTTPTGVLTSATYNGAGEQITTTDGAGNTTGYAYDLDGRTVKTTLPDGSYRTAAYDLAGHPVTQSDYTPTSTLLRTQSATYDQNGNQSAGTDYLGDTTQFAYNADDELIWQNEPVTPAHGTTPTVTITTTYGYDPAGNRTQATTGNHNTTVYTFNPWGLPESKIVPAAGSYTAASDRTYTTVYDLDANPIQQSQPGGVTVTNNFDALGDMTGQSGTGGTATSTATRAFGFDLDGRVTSAATQTTTGTTLSSDSFTYDERGSLLSASGNSGTSSFTYTPDNAMHTRTDASGTSTYAYDTAGRLQGDTDPLTGTAATYTYNTLDQVHTITYGSSDVRTLNYDNLHRLATDALTNGTYQVAAIDYSYNNNDQETGQTTYGIGTTSATASVANTYTYDQAGRITSWTNHATGTTTSYAYDQDGNRTCITTNTAGCTTANSTYTYNTRDQLTADGTHTYTYAANGTLTATTTTATGAIEASTFDAYQQTATDAGTGYTYDALGRTLTAATNTLTYSGQGNQVATDTTATYARDPGGTVTADTSGGYTHETWTDLHNNLVATFTPTATGLARWQTYDPLGNVVSSSYWSLGLGYQSGYTSNGKINMASRWYTPATGQFTSADSQDNNPAPESVNANPYTYANDNPLTGTDPSGHGTPESNQQDYGDSGGGVDTLAPPEFDTEPGSIDMSEFEKEWPNASAGILSRLGGFMNTMLNTSARIEEFFKSGDIKLGELRTLQEEYAAAYQGEAYLLASLGDNTDLRSCISEGICADPTIDNSTDPCDYAANTPLCRYDMKARLRTANGNGQGNGGGGNGDGNCTNCNYTPPPPPLWLTTKNPNSATCKATSGLVCSTTTVGQANLPSAILPNSAYVPQTAPSNISSLLSSLNQGIRIRGDDSSCDTGAGYNEDGNIVYLPRHLQAGECVATGAFGTLTSADLPTDERPSLKFDIPGLKSIPFGDRARGHLIAFSYGGSNTDTRNFVPMYQQANQKMFDVAESPILNALKNGETVWVEVIPIYGSQYSPIPTSIDIYARGGINESCTVYNDPYGGFAHC